MSSRNAKSKSLGTTSRMPLVRPTPTLHSAQLPTIPARCIVTAPTTSHHLLLGSSSGQRRSTRTRQDDLCAARLASATIFTKTWIRVKNTSPMIAATVCNKPIGDRSTPLIRLGTPSTLTDATPRQGKCWIAPWSAVTLIWIGRPIHGGPRQPPRRKTMNTPRPLERPLTPEPKGMPPVRMPSEPARPAQPPPSEKPKR